MNKDLLLHVLICATTGAIAAAYVVALAQPVPTGPSTQEAVERGFSIGLETYESAALAAGVLRDSGSRTTDGKTIYEFVTCSE